MNSDQNGGSCDRRAPWICFRLGPLAMIQSQGTDQPLGPRAHAPHPQPLAYIVPPAHRVEIRSTHQLPFRTSGRPKVVIFTRQDLGSRRWSRGAAPPSMLHTPLAHDRFVSYVIAKAECTERCGTGLTWSSLEFSGGGECAPKPTWRVTRPHLQTRADRWHVNAIQAATQRSSRTIISARRWLSSRRIDFSAHPASAQGARTGHRITPTNA